MSQLQGKELWICCGTGTAVRWYVKTEHLDWMRHQTQFFVAWAETLNRPNTCPFIKMCWMSKYVQACPFDMLLWSRLGFGIHVDMSRISLTIVAYFHLFSTHSHETGPWYPMVPIDSAEVSESRCLRLVELLFSDLPKVQSPRVFGLA